MKKQNVLDEYWNRNSTSSVASLSSPENDPQQHSSSSSPPTPTLTSSSTTDESASDIELVFTSSSHLSTSVDQNPNQESVSFSSTGSECCEKPISMKKPNAPARRKYLTSWEKRPEAMYRAYVRNSGGELAEKLLPWLYLKKDAMRCFLCEKHGKKRNTNGRLNKR